MGDVIEKNHWAVAWVFRVAAAFPILIREMIGMDELWAVINMVGVKHFLMAVVSDDAQPANCKFSAPDKMLAEMEWNNRLLERYFGKGIQIVSYSGLCFIMFYDCSWTIV